MSALLSVTTFLPLAGALLLLFLPREEERLLRAAALSVALVTFLVSLAILAGFDATQAGMQLEVNTAWIASLGINYHLGVDGISLFLVLLTTFLSPIVLLSAFRAITRRVKEFLIAMLILETGMVGAFLALDLFLFYVFWELMLVPMYLIIGVWGGERRVYAAIKFVLFTLLGSLLMLVAILYLYVKHHEVTGVYTFDLAAIQSLLLPRGAQLLCFLAFALAFAIKVPMFPLHTWLPDAHVEAPTAGSVILAGVLLKFGTYGFLRFALPLFPWASAVATPYIAVLALIGIVYASLVAWAQPDIKKLIAYSSVAHLGFVMLGLSAWNLRGIEGGIFVMLSHGLSTGALFLCVGVLYERRHTRLISEYGGVWAKMPLFSACFMIATLASIGLPGLSGFVGEFLVLVGTFDAPKEFAARNLSLLLPHAPVFAAIAATGVILGAVYMLWMFQKVMFGPLSNPRNRTLPDLSLREGLVFAPVVVLMLWFGIAPGPILSRMDASVGLYLDTYKRKLDQSLAMGRGDPARLMTGAAKGALTPGARPAAGPGEPVAPAVRGQPGQPGLPGNEPPRDDQPAARLGHPGPGGQPAVAFPPHLPRPALPP
jgi:NADH-quinone oxidoreductase subunit M